VYTKDSSVPVHPHVALTEEEEEVIRTVEEADLEFDDVNTSRIKFEEWLASVKDQERRFTSTPVMCQVQYNEILEYTRGWPEPNMFKTAACSVLFDKLVPCYVLKRHSLLEQLKDDLLQAVYAGYSPQVASSGTYYDHIPFFVSAQEALARQKEVDRKYEEAQMIEKVNKSSKKIVKSVEARNLERLRFYFINIVWQSWIDAVITKQKLIASLRQSLMQSSAQRQVRQ
jgi:hypothetical protein